MSIYYQDESSFDLSQKVWRILCDAWTKPRLKGKEKRHDGLSITGAYSIEWKFVYRSSKKKKQEDFLDFLYQLRHTEKRKRIILVVDNARIHHAKKVKEYCESRNIKLVYLPPYSPELNPIEFLRKRLKRTYRNIQRKYDEIKRWVQEAARQIRPEFGAINLSDRLV